MSGRPRVAVIGTGGTISSLAAHGLDTIDYPDSGSKLAVEAVLARVPELAAVAEAVPVPFKAVSSTALTVGDWLALRATIRGLFAADDSLAGIAVLHGTATLEETAFFLQLTLACERPVVIVGAQRPLNAVGSDAPMNLVAALRVAGAPEARGHGVLVVLNDEIHAARDVLKTSTYRLQTFRSPDFGMLGQVDGDRIVFRRRVDGAADAPFASLSDDLTWPRVDILYSYLGADAVLIDAAVGAGAAGLVSAGFPPGLLTPAAGDAFEALAARGFPVVLASRAPSGRVGERTRPTERGLVAAGDLSPQKARILLLLALASGYGLDAIRDVFRRA